MDSIRITAGGETLIWFPDFVLQVVRNGQEYTMRADQIRSGDQIIVESRWTPVTNVETAVAMHDDKPDPEEGYCFPAEARVYTLDRGQVPISHVTIGTRVLTGAPSKAAVYSPIYLMAHADPSATMKCVQIVTERTTLELSGGHFVVIVDDNGEERNVTARNVKTGDIVKVYDEAEKVFRLTPVRSLGVVERQGRFAPFTLEGTVVMEGVAASCYEETCRVPPSWAHALLGPVRWAWRLSPSAFALLSSPRDLKGLPAWISWLMPRVLPLLPNMNTA